MKTRHILLLMFSVIAGHVSLHLVPIIFLACCLDFIGPLVGPFPMDESFVFLFCRCFCPCSLPFGFSSGFLCMCEREGLFHSDRLILFRFVVDTVVVVGGCNVHLCVCPGVGFHCSGYSLTIIYV